MVVDLPESKSGDDLGPTALELAVMGSAGCITTIWAVVAKNSKVSYEKVDVELDAEKPDDTATVTSVKAVVYVQSNETEDTLKRCLDKTLRSCPVGRLFEQAGVNVQTELKVVKG